LDNTDELTEQYIELTHLTKDIDIFDRNGTLENFATEIYHKRLFQKCGQSYSSEKEMTLKSR
jgi:hypothetical protein